MPMVGILLPRASKPNTLDSPKEAAVRGRVASEWLAHPVPRVEGETLGK